MSDTRTLPHAYDLLADLTAWLDGYAPNGAAGAHDIVQRLTIELWNAGQVEHRAGMAGPDSEYDPPLWCKGESLEMVTKRIGVPWNTSDPRKDHGRGRSWKV